MGTSVKHIFEKVLLRRRGPVHWGSVPTLEQSLAQRCRAAADRKPSAVKCCTQCGADFDDVDLRYCSRCGAEMAPAAEAAEAPGPQPGQIIAGRYRIIKLLGSGGMGAVYKVEHIMLHKLAALKMLHPSLASDRETVRRFRREARAVSLLTHPNAVQVFDFGEADGCLYMVMEMLRGQNLGSILEREGRMSWERAAPLVRQVCDALGEAHEAGIIHRDLKPENVLVSHVQTLEGTRETAKVLDFGLAKLCENEDLSAVTGGSNLLGTPYYMSPEQIENHEPDRRSDIYSLGALLYTMITGEPVFIASSPFAVMTQHVRSPPIPPSQRCPAAQIDPRVDALVLRCLAKKPADRFSRVEELRCALDNLDSLRDRPAQPVPLAEEPTQLIDPTPALSRADIDQFEGQLKLRRRFGILAIPLLLMIALATSWIMAGRDQPHPVETEVEPNNEPAQANLIASGRAVRGEIGIPLTPERSDRDLFRIHVDAAPAIGRFALTGVPSIDLMVVLFDSAGSPIAESNWGGPGEGELLPNQRLESGDYYLQVREAEVQGQSSSHGQGRPYRLEAEWRLARAGDESEPDDNPMMAEPLALGTTVEGFLHRPGDVDVFRLTSDQSAAGTLAGEIPGIPGVDIAIVLLPATTGGRGKNRLEDLVQIAGAQLIDRHGVGEGEQWSQLLWHDATPPLLVVARKPPPVGEPGLVDRPYRLIVQ